MKIKFYRAFFRLFSYLSDKTNGFPLFVKYKILLGTIIVGVTTTACPSRIIHCYVPPYVDNDTNVRCYKAAIPTDTIQKADTIDKSRKDDVLLCYGLRVTPDTLDVKENKKP